MKKILILFTFLMSSLYAFGQVYEIPKRVFLHPEHRLHFIGLFKQSANGVWQYTDYGNGREMNSSDYFNNSIGNEHYFCYDKKNNIFYFYTDNVIGYYNPTSKVDLSIIKKGLKENNVPKVTIETLPTMLSEVLKAKKDLYDKKNEETYETIRRVREKFVKDSIETAKRKELEQEEYRRTHDWRDLSMSKSYGLKCEFCDINHYMKKYRVMFISADTLYYLLEKPDMSYLGINHVGIHYSTLTREFKNDNQFKEYVSIWRDSIANNNNFSNQSAAFFNLIQYNEFKDKVYKAAPNGFMQKWGWELNSAQGIEPYFCFFNSSKKTIKYVDFYFSVFNAVGDKCYLKYERSYIGNVRGVGPVEPFDSGSWNWDRATHYTSGDASEMRIVKLVITYMDGTTKTLPNSSIIYDNNN